MHTVYLGRGRRESRLRRRRRAVMTRPKLTKIGRPRLRGKATGLLTRFTGEARASDAGKPFTLAASLCWLCQAAWMLMKTDLVSCPCSDERRPSVKAAQPNLKASEINKVKQSAWLTRKCMIVAGHGQLRCAKKSMHQSVHHHLLACLAGPQRRMEVP